MTLYHWIATLTLADVLLVLFVRGADLRCSERARRIEMEFE